MRYLQLGQYATVIVTWTNNSEEQVTIDPSKWSVGSPAVLSLEESAGHQHAVNVRALKVGATGFDVVATVHGTNGDFEVTLSDNVEVVDHEIITGSIEVQYGPVLPLDKAKSSKKQ